MNEKVTGEVEMATAAEAKAADREKIVILDAQFHNPGDLSWDHFGELGELRIVESVRQVEVPKLIKDATVVLTTVTRFTRKIFEGAKNLKYLGALTIGYDLIDLEAAKEFGVTVTNVPGFCSATVGQHAVALLLEICNHVGYYGAEVREGRWVKSRPKCYTDFPILELDGLTMGVVGLGRIGLAVARAAVGLGMRVLADQDHPNPRSDRLAEYVPLPQVMSRSDVLVLACPLTPSTERMINRESIAGMKDGVIIINVARGKLIDEEALSEALYYKKVRAAGLDVVSVEPLTAHNPLGKARNVFMTPHLAGTSLAARKRLMASGWENLFQFLKGNPVNVVGG
ncbi:MAG: D-2-hydroxyacid dehydrogenase [Deltaproteobacteria bacterium]|jgi:glycerate dehydrogenase|nr:D-2-hydroxyacid dehydrogenase [Deltaproteobacteria bacterium]